MTDNSNVTLREKGYAERTFFQRAGISRDWEAGCGRKVEGNASNTSRVDTTRIP